MEALAAVRAQWAVDPRRIGVAGFSMGGGSTWHLATHYPGLWATAFPGAGFAETAVFTQAPRPRQGTPPRLGAAPLAPLRRHPLRRQSLQRPPPSPTAARSTNRSRPPTSWPTTPRAKASRSATSSARKPRTSTTPKRAPNCSPSSSRTSPPAAPSFPRRSASPPTPLRYADSAWVRVEGLAQHWERSDVRARLGDDRRTVTATTKNVTRALLPRPHPRRRHARRPARGPRRRPAARLRAPRRPVAPRGSPGPGLRKRPWPHRPDQRRLPGLVPLRAPLRPAALARTRRLGSKNELTAARRLWRDVYRGDVRVQSDRAVTADDLARHPPHPLGRPVLQRPARENRRAPAAALGREGPSRSAAIRIRAPITHRS
jgi:hypothetical protein